MSANEELTCRELVEVITEYLEETLPEIDRSRFEAHLAECPGCTIYLEQMRTTIRLSGRLTEDSLGSRARTELLETFRSWKGR